MLNQIEPTIKAVLFILLITPALASGADRKIISSAICQAMTPAGAAQLRHNGSSLEALEVDVTVICPIIKDNHGPLQSVEVRHKRPENNQSPFASTVSGQVFSCSSNGGCSVTSENSTSSGGSLFRSIIFNPLNLPGGNDRYYYYKSVLPKKWKIVAFIFTQS